MANHDDLPLPQSAGALEPPKRRPPTAVGVLTPPPPGEPVRKSRDIGFRRRLRPWHGLLLSLSGAGFVVGGGWIAVGLGTRLGVLLGSAVIATGGAQWLVVARRFGRRVDELDVLAMRPR